VGALAPDAVLVAAGACPIIPDLPGVNGSHVYTVDQVLRGEAGLAGKKVAVIGSGLTGLETAELLQQDGNETLIVEMLDSVAPGAYMQNVLDVQSRLPEEKTEYLLSHRLTAIQEGAIELKHMKTGETVVCPVDAVVLSVGYKPDAQLTESFQGLAPVVQCIGDAVEVKNIGRAVRSGHEAGYFI